MIWAIILTIIICSLVFLVYIQFNERKREEQKCREFRAENKRLKARLDRYDDYEIHRLCRENYRRGIDDGSKVDTLYRNILNKYNAQERFTVMMHGEPEDRGDRG